MATLNLTDRSTSEATFAAGCPTPAEVVDLPSSVVSPEVSVVTATYNHCHFALDLLEALSRQQRIRFEVVIVDDGSVDGSFPALVHRATDLGLSGRIIRLAKNQGRSRARNLGVLYARSDLIAFTDSDCLPTPEWLEAGVAAFTDPRVGIVQGPVLPAPGQARPFFNHFIEITQFDGTFSTCNVFYRRDAILRAGGFDPEVIYWEDVDLGWRTRRAGWNVAFASGALVHHQVLHLSPARWLKWPLHFKYMPAKAARYPEYRRHLFLGVWVSWFHALFDLAAIGVPLAALVHRGFAVLALPYLLMFPFRYGLKGRLPVVKAGLHLVWDMFSFCVLVVSSFRHRAPVL